MKKEYLKYLVDDNGIYYDYNNSGRIYFQEGNSFDNPNSMLISIPIVKQERQNEIEYHVKSHGNLNPQVYTKLILLRNEIIRSKNIAIENWISATPKGEFRKYEEGLLLSIKPIDTKNHITTMQVDVHKIKRVISDRGDGFIKDHGYIVSDKGNFEKGKLSGQFRATKGHTSLIEGNYINYELYKGRKIKINLF